MSDYGPPMRCGKRRYAIDAGDGITVHACVEGMDEQTRDALIAVGRAAMRPAMGAGGPCMSCGGNDGYGPAPHHAPGCYFASEADANAS